MKFIFGKFTFTIGGLLLALVQYALALLGALMADSSGASLVDIHQSAPVLIAFLVFILLLPILGFLADQSIDRKLTEQQQFRPKFLNLKKYLDYLARYAENIQQEDFSIELNIKRKDRLSAALASIRSKLKAQKEDYDHAQWLIHSLQELRAALRKPANDSGEVCQHTLNQLIQATGAISGSIYLENGIEGTVLRKASYAIHESQLDKDRFYRGEGLIGQCYQSGEVTRLDNVEDASQTHFTIGHIQPRQVILVPVVYQDHVHGVVEINASHTLQNHEVNYLELATELLLSALVGVLRRPIPHEAEVPLQPSTAVPMPDQPSEEVDYSPRGSEPTQAETPSGTPEYEDQYILQDQEASETTSTEMGRDAVEADATTSEAVAEPDGEPTAEPLESPEAVSASPEANSLSEASETATQEPEPPSGTERAEPRFELLGLKNWLEDTLSSMAWTRISMRLLKHFKDTGIQLNRVTEQDTVDLEQLQKILQMTSKLYEQEVPREVIEKIQVSGSQDAIDAVSSVERPSKYSEGATAAESTEQEIAASQTESTAEWSDERTPSESRLDEAPSSDAAVEAASPTETATGESPNANEDAEPASESYVEADTIQEETRDISTDQEKSTSEISESYVAHQTAQELVGEKYYAEPLIRWSEQELSPLAWSSALSQSSQEIKKLNETPEYFEDREALIPEDVMYIITNSFENNLKVEIPPSVLQEARVESSSEEETEATPIRIETIYEESSKPVIHREEVKSEEEQEEEAGALMDFEMEEAKAWVDRNISPIAWVRIVSRVGSEFRQQGLNLNKPEQIHQVPEQLLNQLQDVVQELFDRDLIKGVRQEQKEAVPERSPQADHRAEPSTDNRPSEAQEDGKESDSSTASPTDTEDVAQVSETGEPAQAESDATAETHTAGDDEDELRYKALTIKNYCDEHISPIAWIRATSRIARVLRKEGLKINNPDENTLLRKRHVDLLSNNIKELFDIEIPDSVKYATD